MRVACLPMQRLMEGEEKMGRHSTARILCGLAVSGAASLVAYAFAIRPWHLRWGATDEEIARETPLDERVKNPTYVTNRAITINAKPEDIWPWLAQMGELPRGGFYSYLWVERMMGMRVTTNPARCAATHPTRRRPQNRSARANLRVAIASHRSRLSARWAGRSA
jgi:hypothetical protein